MSSTYETLNAALQRAFDTLWPGADPVLRRSEHADFQANGVMALAKSLGRPARDVALDVIEALDLDGLASLTVAGPGFLNLTLAPMLLDLKLRELLSDERLGVEARARARRVVIDYSAPNVAKEMHVGHLRSTVIGDALARMSRFAGDTVIARNHVGDWGTPFGMLIEHLVDLGEDEAVAELSIGDLDGFYRGARAKFDADDAFKERARARVVALQGGDLESRRLWRVLVDQSVSYFSEVYAKLDVTLRPEDVTGESSYNEALEGVLDALRAQGLLVESDGAWCVFPPGFTNREGEPLPLIVQKRDEGFGYAATDLAAVRDRVDRLGADELVYVVGAPQAQHLEMVFAVARLAGWLPERVRCEHVAFGNVLGPDRKMFKSRGGETIKLVSLLDEAVERAEVVLSQRRHGLSNVAVHELATKIARASIKYADLSTERQRDYVFDLDRMVSFEGDTGPYLQYAHARVRSIFRRLGEEWSAPSARFDLATIQEHELATALLAFPEAFDAALELRQPHRLCNYLFDLAQRFTAFYDACPVLSAEGDVRAQRLALADLCARTLALGLGVLGIEAPEQM
ncbi:MAG TPA: arginine--tRNA ligase [Acidimicrobiales bacterium]|nr:arginine--tRNA ligase [Acidimicrobiales bacterium]